MYISFGKRAPTFRIASVPAVFFRLTAMILRVRDGIVNEEAPG